MTTQPSNIAPGAVVFPLPSGKYGSYVPAPGTWSRDDRPVVQVAQLINGDWHPTPARHFAETIADMTPGACLSIDFGQGWALTAEDTEAHVIFAVGRIARAAADADAPRLAARDIAAGGSR